MANLKMVMLEAIEGALYPDGYVPQEGRDEVDDLAMEFADYPITDPEEVRSVIHNFYGGRPPNDELATLIYNITDMARRYNRGENLTEADYLEDGLHSEVIDLEIKAKDIKSRFDRLSKLEPDPDGQSWFMALSAEMDKVLRAIAQIDGSMLNHDPR